MFSHLLMLSSVIIYCMMAFFFLSTILRINLSFSMACLSVIYLYNVYT